MSLCSLTANAPTGQCNNGESSKTYVGRYYQIQFYLCSFVAFQLLFRIKSIV